MKGRLEYYLRLRYPVEIVEAEEGGFFAHIPDLPGCMAQGESVEEAIRNLEEARRAWIEVCLEDGREVPAPHDVAEEYSGRFVLRVPKSLHRELATKAKREGISLNQCVLYLLSSALGRVQGTEREAGIERALRLLARLPHGVFSLSWEAFVVQGGLHQNLARGLAQAVEDSAAPSRVLLSRPWPTQLQQASIPAEQDDIVWPANRPLDDVIESER